MELRELKKEVESLPPTSQCLHNFLQHWLKPLRTSPHAELPFLRRLDSIMRTEINKKSVLVHEQVTFLKAQNGLQEKIHYGVRCLVELKLATLHGGRPDHLTSLLQRDEYVNLQQLKEQAESFQASVTAITDYYHEVNELLQQKFSLEEVLFFLDLPHHQYLKNLQAVAQKQLSLATELQQQWARLQDEACSITKW